MQRENFQFTKQLVLFEGQRSAEEVAGDVFKKDEPMALQCPVQVG